MPVETAIAERQNDLTGRTCYVCKQPIRGFTSIRVVERGVVRHRHVHPCSEPDDHRCSCGTAEGQNQITIICDALDANAIEGIIESLRSAKPENWACDEGASWLQKIVDAVREAES